MKVSRNSNPAPRQPLKFPYLALRGLTGPVYAVISEGADPTKVCGIRLGAMKAEFNLDLLDMLPLKPGEQVILEND